ncbi:MAG: hypothetical protein QXI36_00295 [Candidatus Bathyarchaeia archaeon]
MDGQLVSVVQLEKLLFHIPEVCWIGKVFTSQKYRGMGFAASSVLKAIYAKIGFKKYKDRCWLNLNTEIIP